jgi:aryl-alcohol dehydrogenase-like predicted oxidoreductase
MTRTSCAAASRSVCTRLGVDKIDLLQFHWWSFEHPAWLDALHEMQRLREDGLIGALGPYQLRRWPSGALRWPMASKSPPTRCRSRWSIAGLRALSDLCAKSGVKLLAYGTLCGGFLSDKWLGQPEPLDIPDWSRSKYKRFIDTSGGWEAFQGILRALAPALLQST